MKSIASYLFRREVGERRIERHKKNAEDLFERKASVPSTNEPCELSGRCRATFLMDFSPDGSRMASSHGDHTVRITQLVTKKCTHILRGHPRTPWCLAFHPSSNDILASGCLGGEVRIWDLHGRGSEVWTAPHGSVIATLAFHPVDHVLVFATANEIYFWDWSKNQPFACSKTGRNYERVRWLRFDPLGHYLYTGIANATTIQPRIHIGNRSSSGNRSESRTRHRRHLQEYYQEVVRRYHGFLQDRSPTESSESNEPRAADLSNAVEDDVVPDIDLVAPQSPVHEDALRFARQYAADVTEVMTGALSESEHSVQRTPSYSQHPQQEIQSSGRSAFHAPLSSTEYEDIETIFGLNVRNAEPLDGSYESMDSLHAGSERNLFGTRAGSEQRSQNSSFRPFPLMLSPVQSFHPNQFSSSTSSSRLRPSHSSISDADRRKSLSHWVNLDSGELHRPSAWTPYRTIRQRESLLQHPSPDLNSSEMWRARSLLSGSSSAQATSTSGVISDDSQSRFYSQYGMSFPLTATTFSPQLSSSTFPLSVQTSMQSSTQGMDSTRVASSQTAVRFSTSRGNGPCTLQTISHAGSTLPQDNLQVFSPLQVNTTTSPCANMFSSRINSERRTCDDVSLSSASSAMWNPVAVASRPTGTSDRTDKASSSSGASSRNKRPLFAALGLTTAQAFPTAPGSVHQSVPTLSRARTNVTSTVSSSMSMPNGRPDIDVESVLQLPHVPAADIGNNTATITPANTTTASEQMFESCWNFHFAPLELASHNKTNSQHLSSVPTSKATKDDMSTSTVTGQVSSSISHAETEVLATSAITSTNSGAVVTSTTSSDLPQLAVTSHGLSGGVAGPVSSGSETMEDDGLSTTLAVGSASGSREGVGNSWTEMSVTSRYSDDASSLTINIRVPPSCIVIFPSQGDSSTQPVGSDAASNAAVHNSGNQATDTGGSAAASLARTNFDTPVSETSQNSTTNENLGASGNEAFDTLCAVASATLDISEVTARLHRELDSLNRRMTTLHQRCTAARSVMMEVPPEQQLGVSGRNDEFLRGITPAGPDLLLQHTPSQHAESHTDDRAHSTNSNRGSFHEERQAHWALRQLTQRDTFRTLRREASIQNRRLRLQDRILQRVQQNHLHPHYGSSILDDAPNRPNDTLQTAINRAIAGAFMGTGEVAVAANIINLTHRIQRWDFSKFVMPDLTDSVANIVVPHCKLHNDASCDISQDGTTLATFVPSHRGFPDDTILAVYSIESSTLGQCLYTKSFGPNAISVSISPRDHYVLVGLAAKRISWVFSTNQMVAQVYELVTAKAGERSMKHVSDITHCVDVDMRTHVSVNSAKWLPQVGGGLVYGTNRGNLHICQPGYKMEKKESLIDTEDGQHNQVQSIRRNLMHILGLPHRSPLTTSTATQTMQRHVRRSAGTQTDDDSPDTSD